MVEVKFHPKFEITEGYHDIVLIKLNETSRNQVTVQPICLPWDINENLIGRTATLAGWGAETFGKRQSFCLRVPYLIKCF